MLIIRNWAMLFGILLLMISMQAQERSTGYEIWVYNYKSSQVTITDTAFGIIWDENTNLTTKYKNGGFNIEANYYEGSPCTGEYGFFYSFAGNCNPCYTEYLDTLSYGLYKITAVYNSQAYFFYLDLRDGNLPAAPVDINLKFGDGETFWHYKHGAPCNGTPTWHQIQTSTITIWDIWQPCPEAEWTDTSPNTESLQPTTPANLQVVPYNNHPKLTWDHSEPWNGNVTYTVWRNYQGGSYSMIAQGLTNNMYIDNSVTLCCGGPPRTYAYKVRAWSGNDEKPSPEYAGPVSIISKAPIEAKQLVGAGVAPREFLLSTFPTPFNPSTTITYGLPEDSRVELRIYDLMGRQVRTLVSGDRDAGYQSVTWDGQDDSNRSVATGIYIFRISAISLESEQTFTKTGKMVLLR